MTENEATKVTGKKIKYHSLYYGRVYTGFVLGIEDGRVVIMTEGGKKNYRELNEIIIDDVEK